MRGMTIASISMGWIGAIALITNQFGCESKSVLSPTVQVPESSDEMVIQSAKAVRWSSKCDAETRCGLQSGHRRIVISVTAYEPPQSGSPTLVAYLLTANGTMRQEVGRFSVHPNAPFRISEGAEPHNFLVSLADHAELLEEPDIHLEVGFDSSQADLSGGMAAVSIKFTDIDPAQ